MCYVDNKSASLVLLCFLILIVSKIKRERMLQEELDMLFLLEHFSLEDLVKAEEKYVNYQYANTDNIAESYCDVEEYIDDECTTTITTREYSTFIDDSWMNLSFESLIFND